MAAAPPVAALPWYARGDYPALLKMFNDSNKLPATYDAWLKRAELTEEQFQKAGFGIARIWIRPVPFAAWCRARNVSPDQAARLTFVNEAGRHPGGPAVTMHFVCSSYALPDIEKLSITQDVTRHCNKFRRTPPGPHAAWCFGDPSGNIGRLGRGRKCSLPFGNR